MCTDWAFTLLTDDSPFQGKFPWKYLAEIYTSMGLSIYSFSTVRLELTAVLGVRCLDHFILTAISFILLSWVTAPSHPLHSVVYIFWPTISTAKTMSSNSYYTKFATHFLIHPHNQQSVHISDIYTADMSGFRSEVIVFSVTFVLILKILVLI